MNTCRVGWSGGGEVFVAADKGVSGGKGKEEVLSLIKRSDRHMHLALIPPAVSSVGADFTSQLSLSWV